MSVRRVVMRLLGKQHDVRTRMCLFVAAAMLCMFLVTMRGISSDPGLPLIYNEEDKSVLRDTRKLWSVHRPIEMKNYSGKVVVVEEHHEVLQYWLQDSNLPKTGNVLVHIDGHQDGSLPPNAPNMPWFSWPRNTQELRVMMQENDMFITGAVMTGLISRFVYIWPTWDDRNHSRKYEASSMAIGWHVPDPRLSDKPRELCMCEINDKDLGEDGMDCFSAQRLEAQSEEDTEVYVNTSDCHVVTRYQTEEVWDTGAVARLVRGGWITPRDNIILDIDEDFFGCEAAATRFKEVGLPWNTIGVLDQELDKLFCVRDVTSERSTDTFVRDVIGTVMAAGDRMSTDVRRACREKVGQQYLELLKSHKKLVCARKTNGSRHSSKSRVKLLLKVVDIILDMNNEQLKLLRRVGFCLSMSPVTYIDESPKSMPHFGVCHGSTEPDNILITHHVPTRQEIVRQTVKLQGILSLLPQPKHVTVCRSFRDGYTPKEFWPQIEESILDTVKSCFADYNSVHYDPRLLGGPEGWFARQEQVKS